MFPRPRRFDGKRAPHRIPLVSPSRDSVRPCDHIESSRVQPAQAAPHRFLASLARGVSERVPVGMIGTLDRQQMLSVVEIRKIFARVGAVVGDPGRWGQR